MLMDIGIYSCAYVNITEQLVTFIRETGGIDITKQSEKNVVIYPLVLII